MSRSDLQITAIVAITDGRLDDALTAIEAMQHDVPIRPGVCRYCSCTEEDPCAVIVQAGAEFPPAAVACSWFDGQRTVCSNKRCIDRWLNDGAPVRTGSDLPRAPLVVLP